MYNTLPHFNDFDHNFCESTIYSETQHPEYINAISSLFITFIGINGLLTPSITFSLSSLYCAFIINGVSSCLYHYYNTIGYGLLDRMSMILIAMTSINLFINKIYKLLQIMQFRNICIISMIIHLCSIIYFCILYTIVALHLETIFNCMFALFLCSLCILTYYINKYYLILKIPLALINLEKRGIKLIICSGIFWIISEKLCYSNVIIKYLFGHLWWHICVSYGGYLVSLVPHYMDLQSQSNNNSKIGISITIQYDKFHIPYLLNHNDDVYNNIYYGNKYIIPYSKPYDNIYYTIDDKTFINIG